MWRLAFAGAAEPFFTARGRVQIVSFDPLDGQMTHEHGLGDPVARVYGKRDIRGIEEQNHELATIIGIDSTRRVQHGDAVFEGESASRADLDMAVARRRDAQPRVYKGSAVWWDLDVFRACEVVTCRLRALLFGDLRAWDNGHDAASRCLKFVEKSYQLCEHIGFLCWARSPARSGGWTADGLNRIFGRFVCAPDE